MESLNLQAFSSVRDAALSLQPGSQPKAFSIEAKGMHGCTHTYNVSMQQHPNGSIDVDVKRKLGFFSNGETSKEGANKSLI